MTYERPLRYLRYLLYQLLFTTTNFFLRCFLLQKQPSRRVLRKKCSENMQQIYRRRPIRKCGFKTFQSNFIEIALRHGCSPVNLLHNFRTPFLKNTSGWLLLLLLNYICRIWKEELNNYPKDFSQFVAWFLKWQFAELVTEELIC